MPARTSLSHPLAIDSVECCGGQIGMTICPGMKTGGTLATPWDRDLEADMGAIRDWSASAVATLIEDHEYAMLQVEGLGERAEALGLEWHPLPIPDISVPGPRFETLWLYSGHLLRRRLARGERIVVHCRGGLGRTGMIAARLLIETGTAPHEAIARVRAARPGTIETVEQDRHVRALSPPGHGAEHLDRVLGCLLGGALGDAFGHAVEFMRLAEIRESHGPRGLTEPLEEEGRLRVTDDTQMTLFVAEGLVHGAPALAERDREALLARVRRATLDWHKTQTRPRPPVAAADSLLRHEELWDRRAPGKTCLSACEAGAPGTPEAPVNASKGCGGVMRVAPVGLISGLPREVAFDLAARIAAQTHGHPSGYISAGALAALLGDLLRNAAPRTALAGALAVARGWPGAEETVAALQAAERLAAERPGAHEANIRALGEGWVGEEALAIALYAFLSAQDFTDLLRIAANHDGDSDSTAAIAAQLWGARHGLAGMPHRWVRRLDVLEPLLDIAGRLARMSA